MAQERKQLLIVDDTKVDRIVLRSILDSEFDIMEANSGNAAFEYLTTQKEQINAILLDLSMPHIDGFDVLKFMKEKGMDDIPVFVITAEPTRDNVEKALQYHVDEFIGKPFDKEDIIWRLHSRLGISPEYDLKKENLTDTMKYIADLESVYNCYLANFGKNENHYKVMVDIMKILLNAYSRTAHGAKLNHNSIELISKAAYFCDIGEMMIPDKRVQMMSSGAGIRVQPQSHTIYGANLIKLNHSKSCHYFVEICSSMCLYHHERYDGKGYPYGITGDNNSIYNQMCRIVDEFVQKRSIFYGKDTKPIKYIIKRLINDDAGMASKEVRSLLDDSQPAIVNYFMRQTN